jgi:hypothetical protein
LRAVFHSLAERGVEAESNGAEDRIDEEAPSECVDAVD